MELRYQYRIYPNQKQVDQLSKTFGCARVVYNNALNYKNEEYEKIKPIKEKPKEYLTEEELNKLKEFNNNTSYAGLCRYLTKLKKEKLTFLKGVSSVALQQSLNHLDQAFKDFYKGIRAYPKFKKKDNTQSISLMRNGFVLKDNNTKISLGRIESDIEIKLSRPLPSIPSSVTIIKDTINRYYASFVVSIDKKKIKLSTLPKESEIGIDLGTSKFLTTSKGKTEDNPKFFKQLEKKLIKAQRIVSRKKKGSKNRIKAIYKFNKYCSKVKRCRLDHHHKLSFRIIGENQSIYVEDIDTKELSKRKLKGSNKRNRLSKSILDSGWAMFLDMLKYKAILYGKTFDRVCSRYTSQICNVCKYHIGKLDLSIRTWYCRNCTTKHDRDVNAAKNILTVGLTGICCSKYVKYEKHNDTFNTSNHVCGESVRPEQSGSFQKRDISSVSQNKEDISQRNRNKTESNILKDILRDNVPVLDDICAL